MKTKDPFVQRILASCVGISAILLSCSLFLFSINYLKASVNEFPFEAETTSTRYDMDIEVTFSPKGIREERILVWDKESGASKIYYYNSKGSYSKTRGQLPSNPMD